MGSDQRRIPASYSALFLLSRKIQRKYLDISPPPSVLFAAVFSAYKSLVHYLVSKGSRRMGRIPSLHLLFIWRGCAHTCVWSGIHQRAQLDQHFPTDSMIGPCSTGRYHTPPALPAAFYFRPVSSDAVTSHLLAHGNISNSNLSRILESTDLTPCDG